MVGMHHDENIRSDMAFVDWFIVLGMNAHPLLLMVLALFLVFSLVGLVVLSFNHPFTFTS
jgi:hypothetical protein